MAVRSLKSSLAIPFPLALLLANAWAASTPLPAPPAVVRIETTPRAIVLNGRESRQQLLVTGYRTDGSVTDLTDHARFVSADDRTAQVDESGVAHPLSDGKTTLSVSALGKTLSVPVMVKYTKRPFIWSFANHVESVFSKQGCNMGTCHGAGGGKGGLRLTLRAYDPEVDYARLRYEGRGRRIVKTNPMGSLILRKPSLAVEHVGGLKLRRDTLEYRVVSQWIAGGARGPRATDPKLVRLAVSPSERTLTRDATQRLLVTAYFSDGRSEDVTHWARYASNEEPIAKVDEEGRVQMRGIGETAISVWYLGKVAFARVSVPFPNRVDRTAYSRFSRNNFVDDLTLAKQAQLHLLPSALCTDGEFVRRAYLDATGTLPTAAETRAFLTNPDPSKRNKLIDALLDRPEYLDYWTYRWADLLRVNRDLLGSKGMWSFYAWIRESVAANKPWDLFARELLTATGASSTCGPANFYRMASKPEELAETVSQALLGIRVQCAHCHNHPFEKWTQTDYYRMANFFARVGKKGAGGSEVVFVSESGDVAHPKLGRPMAPAAFDGPALALDAPGDRRAFLADWMTASDNPYFARSIVNRVWRYFMGRGLVEPVDDMRLTNPASNEPLLHTLTKDFTAHGFDLKRLMRTIMRSRTYQLSARPNTTNARDDRFYSHYLPRRLTAEALLDAICQVTGATEKYPGTPRGARAISLPDTRVDSSFLDVFGRPPRVVTCECERNTEPNMAQALHLINAATLNEKISAKGGTIERLLETKLTDEQALEELYVACFSRMPTPRERSAFHKALASATSATTSEKTMGDRTKAARAQVYADLLWALVSSPEFVFNH